MAILLSGISLQLGSGDAEMIQAAASVLSVPLSEIATVRIKKQSIDARRSELRLVLTVLVDLHDSERQKALEGVHGSVEAYRELDITYGTKPIGQPVVVGAGPCGLFAALELAKHGYAPLLIERGRDVAARSNDVERLRKKGVLDPESNVCFGAGGAGAFSDGKLTTRIKDPRSEYVLQTLVDCGAPDDILTAAKPHTGTEHIRTAVSGIIEKIVSLGGEVSFESRLTDIFTDSNEICGIAYIKNGLKHTVDTHAASLCIGHSARDTYQLLLQKGVLMTPKPFAVGVRIEHLREFIDKAQYGGAFGHPMLGAAEYRLTANSGGRGVYTFCMCPGGEVICASTEPDGVVVNGMSYYARDAVNSNSAVVVGVSTADFESGPLGGVAFQQRLERDAYRLAAGQGAPAQTLRDFFDGKATKQFGSVKPSYRPYAIPADLHGCLPGFITNALKEGLSSFNRKLKGFAMPDAVLTGVETRTSAPVRLPRRADFQSENISGLFPAGEGAGYAGGIVSAAVDGIKCAQAIMSQYAHPQK
jgi:uncharacterized FAD-dependent dehydrogenase